MPLSDLITSVSQLHDETGSYKQRRTAKSRRSVGFNGGDYGIGRHTYDKVKNSVLYTRFRLIIINTIYNT